MCQPTSSCSQPGSAGLWQAGCLAAPSLTICCSKPSPISSAARKGPKSFNKSPYKLNPATANLWHQGWLSLTPVATSYKAFKNFGRRPPKGQPSTAPSLPNYCQELAASAFKQNRCKASTYPRAFIPLGRHKFGWGEATRGNPLKQ